MLLAAWRGGEHPSGCNPMKVRSARTLVFSRENGQIVAFNFLTKSTFSCAHDLLVFLAFLDDWKSVDELGAFVPTMSAEELDATIRQLLDVGAITIQGGELVEIEDEFRSTWGWGLPAALFHFSVQDRDCISLEESEARQLVRLAECDQPPLFQTNDWAGGDVQQLPPALDGNELLQLMARRRTIRSATPTAIPLSQLSECLFAGMGITGGTRNCAGTLPLSMTPSGGARNPYEAYVYARFVEGLEVGFYHYSAFDHTLARIRTNSKPKPSELLGGQTWADEMPCIIILFALFERTMWKYDDANAYRVVLIEAGHIGQNIMLAATQRGLSACPTAALNHAALKRCVAEPKITHSPVYALTLASPGAASS